MSINIWWLRKDIRLADNQALQAALAHGHPVVPLFILDPGLTGRAGRRRMDFLFEGLSRLDEDLQSRDSRLVVRSGDPVDVFQELKNELDFGAVYAEEDTSPYARSRDARVGRIVPLHLTGGATVFPLEALLKTDGKPYTVFTPFSRHWKALPFPAGEPVQPPERFATVPAIYSPGLPPFSTSGFFPAGTGEAVHRLKEFLNGPVFVYAEERNRCDRQGTSGLSPYLRFEMLSARQAAAAALKIIQQTDDLEIRQNVGTWLDELIWREFYISILANFSFVAQTAFNASLRQIPWRNDPAGLNAWQQGCTGYPLVDAAMHQLLETGWMHNRGRMVVASFLVKDLLINWQEGESWFMQHLIDGDPASNNGGWQWTAGVGTDAAPYFRIFNPTSQAQKCDPDGIYIRTWVPELADVPLKFIHQPWLMPLGVQEQCGCLIGKKYPSPIVDHPQARERTLAAYQQSRALYSSSMKE